MKHTLVLFLVLSAWTAARGDTASVTADTLDKWITIGTLFDFLLIDLRDTSEIVSIISTDSCRPYNLSWRHGTFSQEIPVMDKSVPVVLYCAGGSRSRLAMAQLDSAGFAAVYSLTGGFGGWSGSTRSITYFRSMGDFPSPSMLKRPATLCMRRIRQDVLRPMARIHPSIPDSYGIPVACGGQSDLRIISADGRNIRIPDGVHHWICQLR